MTSAPRSSAPVLALAILLSGSAGAAPTGVATKRPAPPPGDRGEVLDLLERWTALEGGRLEARLTVTPTFRTLVGNPGPARSLAVGVRWARRAGSGVRLALSLGEVGEAPLLKVLAGERQATVSFPLPGGDGQRLDLRVAVGLGKAPEHAVSRPRARAAWVVDALAAVGGEVGLVAGGLEVAFGGEGAPALFVARGARNLPRWMSFRSDQGTLGTLTFDRIEEAAPDVPVGVLAPDAQALGPGGVLALAGALMGLLDPPPAVKGPRPPSPFVRPGGTR